MPCPPAGTFDEPIKALDDAVSGFGDKDRIRLREWQAETAEEQVPAKYLP